MQIIIQFITTTYTTFVEFHVKIVTKKEIIIKLSKKPAATYHVFNFVLLSLVLPKKTTFHLKNSDTHINGQNNYPVFTFFPGKIITDRWETNQFS